MISDGAKRLDRATGANIFGIDIAGYHTARLDYPPVLYDAIRGHCGGNARSVIEIGPGTGLATQDILMRLNPSRLVTVEADKRLAAYLEAALPDPRLSVVSAGFVEADLTGNFDLACSAAAFHWIDPRLGLAKLRSILRPSATLALWWNSYRQPGEDELADAVLPLLADTLLAPSEGANGHHSLDVDHHRAALSEAGFTRFESHISRRERYLSAQEARALYASYSYVRVLPSAQREDLLDAIAQLVETQFGGSARNVVLTALYLAATPANPGG